MGTAKVLLFLAGVAVLLAAGLVDVGTEKAPVPQRTALEPRPQQRAADLPPTQVAPIAGIEARDSAAPVVPVAQAGWRALFERFLMHGGDRPMAMIRGDLENELAQRLPEAQLPAGKALLDKYIRYREESALLEHAIDTAATPEALRLHLVAIQDLRARLFSKDEAAGLFAADDAYEQTLLARMQIRYSATLTEDEKHEQAQALESSLSPEIQAAEALRSRIVRVE